MPGGLVMITDSPTRSVHFRRIGGALFALLALALKPTTAEAQYTMQQCTWVLNQQTQAFKEGAPKKIISLERQYLSFCREFMRADEYAPHLAGLAAGLNGDGQPGEALAIADRCLQMSPENLPCRSEKANALYLLGRLSDAKSLIERSLFFAAITEFDAAAKRLLRSLLNRVNAAGSASQGEIDFSEFAEPAPTQPTPRPSPSVSGSSACAQPPTQGIYAISDNSQRVARLTIRVASGANYFVKLEHAATGRPAMSFFIYGGSTLEAMVPIGDFTLKYATGKMWCGEAELFGQDTLTNKAERTLRFERLPTGDGYTLRGWVVDLVLHKGGNLRTARIPRETF